MLESVFSFFSGMFSGIGTLNMILIVIGLIILIFVAMKLFGFLIRAMLAGLAFGLIPVVLNYLGFAVAVTIDSVLSTALLGIVAYILYAAVKSGYGIVKLVTWPIRKLFGLFRGKPKQAS